MEKKLYKNNKILLDAELKEVFQSWLFRKEACGENLTLADVARECDVKYNSLWYMLMTRGPKILSEEDYKTCRNYMTSRFKKKDITLKRDYVKRKTKHKSENGLVKETLLLLLRNNEKHRTTVNYTVSKLIELTALTDSLNQLLEAEKKALEDILRDSTKTNKNISSSPLVRPDENI